MSWMQSIWQYSSLPKVIFYLYQATVPPIIQRFPRALFPVSLRNNTRGALIAFISLRAFRTRRPLETILSRGSHRSLLSLIAFVPLRSFFSSLPWRSHGTLFSRCSHISLLSSSPISSIETGNTWDPWYSTAHVAWMLCLQSNLYTYN